MSNLAFIISMTWQTTKNRCYGLLSLHGFQNHHQTFHNRCLEKNHSLPEKTGPLVHADMLRKYGTGPTCLLLFRSRTSQNSVASRDFRIGPEIRATQKQPIIHERARVPVKKIGSRDSIFGLEILNMFLLSETGRVSGVLPAQRPHVGRVAAILENLHEDTT